jgi:UDPglucose 6-dehydrogenase
VIGTGYVGLVTAACLAEFGNQVLCLDHDANKIKALQEGSMPIHELGLLDMVQINVAADRLKFTTSIEESVAWGQIQFIAVGTPPNEDGSADLQYVIDAAKNIAKYMTEYKLVVDKSTVPVGTADKDRLAMAEVLSKRGVEWPFSIVSNPEFLKEGSAVADFMRPDRIVIGSDDERAAALMDSLYAPFVRNHDRIIHMDIKSAELTKYAANCMLATRISFMNELANLADKLGADIEQVRIGIGSDPRIGYHFLYAGSGYGGSCFPKDLQALIRAASSINQPMRILNAVEETNNKQKLVMLEKIKTKFGTNLGGMKFALWGLSFKPNTDDMREAPSRVIIEGLWKLGATVTAYDPVAMPESKRIYGGDARLSYADSATQALEDADALVIVTEWKEFRAPNFNHIKATLKKPAIFDGRNMYIPSQVKEAGLEYFAIGRC